jgi:formamidopyrimidine-DNA glycosylase
VPELPDLAVYLEALTGRIAGHVLNRVEVRGPFLLRSVEPPLESAFGRKVTEVRRVGKRIAIGFDNGIWLVLHLMIAGRLHWREGRTHAASRKLLAAFEFDSGTLTLTEAGSQHRASLYAAGSRAELDAMDPGGLEVPGSDLAAFSEALRRENHTLKRALTDPRLFSGIGNAYSDEILHAARLSPVALTQKMTPDEMERLHGAAQQVLREWTGKIRAAAGSKFPEKVTAFRDGMAVHGRYGKPCPRCGTAIRRIRYASTETNYCPQCQTGGKLLADRALSRLLREDWPKTVEQWDEFDRARRHRTKQGSAAQKPAIEQHPRRERPR